MQRKTLTIRQLQDCGYTPVYFFRDENEDGNQLDAICIDMVCEWRLTDGKVLFAEVPFTNAQELQEIKEWIAARLGTFCSESLEKLIKLCNKF